MSWRRYGRRKKNFFHKYSTRSAERVDHNGIQEKLFAQVVEMLYERSLILKKGTIVDSTIIVALGSSKNKEKNHPN